MSDQKKARSCPGTFCDQVPRTTERCTINPPGLKSESIELFPQNVSDLTHAREVHRAAVDVHESLEQSEPFSVSSIDGSDDVSFSLVENVTPRLSAGNEWATGSSE
jgi:hypothetical protein